MAETWFLLDDLGRMGPFTRSQLIETIQTYKDREEVLVKREGQKSWQRAGDLPELSLGANAASVAMTQQISSASPEPQIAPEQKELRRAKSRWAKIGAVICFCLAVLAQVLNPQSETIGYFIGNFGGAALLGAFVGFLCGALRDVLAKKGARPAPTQTSNGSKFNLITMHWRGLYPLWVSYWVINVVVAFMVTIVVLIIARAFTTNSGYDPLAIFGSTVTTWLFVVAILIWQIVGLWRSADNYTARRAAIGKKAFWAGLAKIAVILMVLNSIGTFAKSALPQLVETTRIAFMGDPDIPEYAFRLMRNGTEVEITGGFKYGLTDEFRKLLKASRQVRVVHLDSIGGRLGEAEKLYNVIQANSLITYVPSRCASACTLAFAGGKQRYIARSAILGFHGPAFPGMDKSELAASVEHQKQIFAAAGFAPSFVTRALNTPNSDLWKPTIPELLQAKAITGISDGSQFASSGWGEITRETMAEKLVAAVPVYTAVKERFPKSFDGIIDAYYDSYVAGKTQSEMIAAARAKFSPLLNSLMPLADDDVVVDLARLYADQYAALQQKGGATLCYQYASGVGKRNFSDDLPPTIVKRELALYERVIRTAAKRSPITEATLDPIRGTVRNAMLAKGVTTEKLQLLEATTVPPSRHAEYCMISINFFQAIANLPRKDAATFLRHVWADK